MPFNSQGIWVSYNSPEGQLIAQQKMNSVVNAMRYAGDTNPDYATMIAEDDQKTQTANYLNSAKQNAQQNTPEFQAALQAYNSGKAVPIQYQGLFDQAANYFAQGQANPGVLTQGTLVSGINQWNKDSAPSFLDQNMPAIILAAVGGAQLAGGFGTGAAAGTNALTNAAGATGGSLASADAGLAGAYTGLPEASLFNGTGAGLGVGGTSAAAGDLAATGAGLGAAGAGVTEAGSNTAAWNALPGTSATANNPSLLSGLGDIASNAGGALTGTGTGSNVLGSLISAGASLYAGNQANNAITNASNSANAINQQQINNLAPWRAAGGNALTAQQDLMGLGANGANGASGELTALQQSPGYQFGLSQGQRGLDASSAARGGMGSGKAATAASQWNQNYANTGYNNRLSQLSGLSQVGQAAAANQGAVYSNMAGNVANAGLAGANANMQGQIGAGNALSSFLNPQNLNQSTLKAA